MLMYVNILGTKYIYGMPFELLVFSIQKLFDQHETWMVSMDICDRKCNSGD